jgi:hypothetical protein
LGAGADVQFFVDAADVGIDSGKTHTEGFGNLLVQVAASEQIEDFSFAWGEAFGFGTDFGLERLDDFARDIAAHGGAAAADVAQGLEQFFATRLFKKISGCPGGEGFENMIYIFVNGKHDELRSGQLRLESADAFNAANPREVDVRKYDVRLFANENIHRRFGSFKLADTSKTLRVIEPFSENISRWGIVFDDGD